MDKNLSKILANQFVKIISKQKEQQLKGGGKGNYDRKDEKNCPPPFEPDWKKLI